MASIRNRVAHRLLALARDMRGLRAKTNSQMDVAIVNDMLASIDRMIEQADGLSKRGAACEDHRASRETESAGVQ